MNNFESTRTLTAEEDSFETMLENLSRKIGQLIEHRIIREALLGMAVVKHLDPQVAKIAITQQCACQLANFIDELMNMRDGLGLDPESASETVLCTAYGSLRDLEKRSLAVLSSWKEDSTQENNQ